MLCIPNKFTASLIFEKAMKLPQTLQQKLDERKGNDQFRHLIPKGPLVDFASNDYLGLAHNPWVFHRSNALVVEAEGLKNGATGSRLLTGHYPLYERAEATVAQYHNAHSALFFTSGFDANIGLLGSVPQRGDLICYDELCHASIREGIRLSHAKSVKFRHNDLDHLTEVVQRKQITGQIYVFTESVFSMDGDSPNLKELCSLCTEQGWYLILDEAHAVGAFGAGLANELDLEAQVFARLVTFGKAMGCHGAAVLSEVPLREYLINFSKPFMYTTAMPPHAIATIQAAYEYVTENAALSEQLQQRIDVFRTTVKEHFPSGSFLESRSAIQGLLLPKNAKKVSQLLAAKGFDVRPIFPPTVPEGQARLRICLHTFNTTEEIEELLVRLATFVA